MLKVKKLFKRYGYIIPIVFIAYLIIVYLTSESDEYANSKYKLNFIEKAIRSDDNHGVCEIPYVPVNNPDIMKFYNENPTLDCGRRDGGWVFCVRSLCTIREWVVQDYGEVFCTFTELLRKTDYSVKYGKTERNVKKYNLKKSDFAKVTCKAESGQRWIGLVFGARSYPSTKPSDKPLINVLMFGFDSLSRNAFIRKLPKTYNYLTNTLNGHLLQGYNIVGDGTPQALIPILTGRTELELPETRKRIRKSEYVNSYPMIWNDYKKNGYVTAFNEDLPSTGIFTYRLNGFKERPTDHYLRPFYIEYENSMTTSTPYCYGNIPSHQVMLDYTKNLLLQHLSQPTFIFSFHGELSHDSTNLIGVADEDVRNWLADLRAFGALNNTILIMMSDHGSRFASVRNTLQGKQEERLPFFSFAFPLSFQKAYPTEYQNFLQNINRLTTPFDIYETLFDLLKIQGLETVSPTVDKQRSISLLQKIPKTRSCADAYIEPHWCACLNWKAINTTLDIVTRVADTVITTINNFTKSNRFICENLNIYEIHWAMKLEPQENLLKFKQNADIDGFVPDLTSTTKVFTEIYQVKITTTPGYAIYEASVTHSLINDTLNAKISDISRINKYGVQANCIINLYPDLRKYCYCKTI